MADVLHPAVVNVDGAAMAVHVNALIDAKHADLVQQLSALKAEWTRIAVAVESIAAVIVTPADAELKEQNDILTRLILDTDVQLNQIGEVDPADFDADATALLQELDALKTTLNASTGGAA